MEAYYLSLKEGKMPEDEKEVLLSEQALEELGIKKEIGSYVPVSFTLRGQEYNFDMRLAGWYTGNPKADFLIVSETFLEHNLEVTKNTYDDERNRTTNQKYSSMKAENALPDFDGDNKDQRSWTHWMAEWLYDARKACKVGAPICLFIDWRQYPSITDALQWAGWIWRGTAVWDKGNSRPQKGRFRQQAEYIVWGSNGPMPINRPVSCLPGVFRYGNPQNRIHVTEKPLQLMKDVIQICEPGGRILDPFAGAGTTILAAVEEGYETVGIEVTDAYYKLGSDRVKFALEAKEKEESEK